MPKPPTAIEVRDNAIPLTPALVRDMLPADVRVDIHDRGLGRVNSGGLMLRVRPSGLKTWHAIRYHHGKPKPHTLGRYSAALGLDAARKAANAFLDNPDATLNAIAAGSFADVAKQFMELHVGKNGLLTGDEYQRVLDYYVLPRWKDHPFMSIKRRDVADLLDRVELKNGQRQANVVLSVVRKIFAWYSARGDDYVSPIVRGMARGEPVKRKRILTDDELRAFWIAADKVGTYGRFAKFALLCAQRRGKIAAMTWPQLVDGGTTWDVPRARRQKDVAGLLPLPRLALDIIGKQPKLARTEYVFAGRGATPMNGFSKLKRALDLLMLDELDRMARERRDDAMAAKYDEFRALMKQARSKDKDKAEAAQLELHDRWWIFHDLRRTAKSLMPRAGVPREHSERVLGHVIPGAEGIYDRFDYREPKRDALAALAKHVAKIVGLRVAVRGKSARHRMNGKQAHLPARRRA